MVRINKNTHNMENRGTWSSLEVKTKIAYITAIIAFAAGWGLTVAGFIIGAGVVSDSVLWILGQALVYAASVFGVGMYVTNSVRGMKSAIRNFMVDEDRKFRHGEEYQIEDTGENYEA